MEYPKIQTIFKRDSNNIIIPNSYTKEEFQWLKDCKFRAEEKIDGTNIRIELHILDDGSVVHSFEGRTGRAVIPVHLLEKLNVLFPSDKLREVFGEYIGSHITLYGEGYGHKIQGGGGYIPNDVNFILFDVKVDNWWLTREAVEQIAEALSIDVVPIIGYMTIGEACEFVANGFTSRIAQDPNLIAEGLVLKTPFNLLMRDGERIVLKVKNVDFRKWKEKYGSNNIHFDHFVGGEVKITTDIIQPINEKYKE